MYFNLFGSAFKLRMEGKTKVCLEHLLIWFHSPPSHSLLQAPKLPAVLGEKKLFNISEGLDSLNENCWQGGGGKEGRKGGENPFLRA